MTGDSEPPGGPSIDAEAVSGRCDLPAPLSPCKIGVIPPPPGMREMSHGCCWSAWHSALHLTALLRTRSPGTTLLMAPRVTEEGSRPGRQVTAEFTAVSLGMTLLTPVNNSARPRIDRNRC